LLSYLSITAVVRVYMIYVRSFDRPENTVMTFRRAIRRTGTFSTVFFVSCPVSGHCQAILLHRQYTSATAILSVYLLTSNAIKTWTGSL